MSDHRPKPEIIVYVVCFRNQRSSQDGFYAACFPARVHVCVVIIVNLVVFYQGVFCAASAYARGCRSW